MNSQSQSIIRYLVIFKLIALVVFCLIRYEVVSIGDLASFGNEKTDESKEASKESEDKKIKPAEPEVDKEVKEILDDLIALPKLDLEKSQKEEIKNYFMAAEKVKQLAQNRVKFLEEKALSLKKIEKAIDDKLKSLEEERDFFIKTVQKEKDLSEERTKDLVELYGKMEPKKAASIMEQLDKDLTISLFKKLNKKQVTKILESMAPDKSTMLTEYFGRVGSAREYNLLKELNVSLKDEFKDCKK